MTSSSDLCSLCNGAHPPSSPCDTTGHSRVGTILDNKYDLIRVLGAGGMGEVYEARHREIGRRVAIKFLLPRYAAQAEIVARFEKEARAAGSLEHENIAAVYDTGAAPDGARYLVMEFLDGEDCAKFLSRRGPLEPAQAADLVVQVCRGLGVAHALGIVHRDLKPANLFITKRADGTDLIKILDFGIAKLRAPEGAEQSSTTGPVFGTPHYMSPEQARGSRELDERTDTYAVGVILYEFLSGKRPHDGSSALQIAHRIATELPEPLDRRRPGLSRELTEVVSRAMARAPDARFASIATLGKALLPFVATLPPSGATGERPRSLEETRPSPETVAPPSEARTPSAFAPPTTHAPVSPPVFDSRRTPRPLPGFRLNWLVGALTVVLTLGTWAVLRRGSRGVSAPSASSSLGAPQLPVAASVASASTGTVAPVAPSSSVEATQESQGRALRAAPPPPSGHSGARPDRNRKGVRGESALASIPPSAASSTAVANAPSVPAPAVPEPSSEVTPPVSPPPAPSNHRLKVDKQNPYY